jgi:hypothetical protein
VTAFRPLHFDLIELRECERSRTSTSRGVPLMFSVVMAISPQDDEGAVLILASHDDIGHSPSMARYAREHDLEGEGVST